MINEEMYSQLLSALQAIDNKLVETKTDLIKGIQNLDSRMENMETRMENMDTRIVNMEAKLGRDIDNVRIEMRGEFNHLKGVVIDTFKTAGKEINSVKVRIFDIEERLNHDFPWSKP